MKRWLIFAFGFVVVASILSYGYVNWPNHLSKKEFFAFVSAIERGDIVSAQKMLSDKPRLVSARYINGGTLLHEAVSRGDKRFVALLLAKAADVNIQDRYMGTPLHCSAKNEITKLLLAAGADVNAKDREDGLTPLHKAAGFGLKDVVETLILSGADIYAKDHRGKMPTIFPDDRNALEWLMSNRDLARRWVAICPNVNISDGNMTPLHYAAGNGFVDIARRLNAKGADIEAEGRWGERPLYIALDEHRKEMAQFLIGEGADVNAKNNFDETPLHKACWDRELVELLIKKGAVVNVEDSLGQTPLHCAISYDRKDILILLLDKGAKVDAKDKRGVTPLLWAAEGLGKVKVSNPAIIKILLARGADAKAADEFGRAALHAVNNTEAARLLIKAGANVNARNGFGDTPLHELPDKSIAALLIAAGGDVNARNKNGRTPLELAISYSQKDTAELLRLHGGKSRW